jgi:hypothetical protein
MRRMAPFSKKIQDVIAHPFLQNLSPKPPLFRPAR